MKPVIKYQLIYLFVFFILIFSGCNSEYDPFENNDDLIFTKSFEIQIPSYNYLINQSDTIFIQGDDGFYLGIPDTVNSSPVLSWGPSGSPLTMAAIFSDSIVVSGMEIINKDDLVWVWHSGMQNGKDGKINFSDGKSVTVSGDEIIYQQTLMPLNVGTTYYWGVWSWNKEGTRIWYSSRQLSFIISE